MKPSSTRQAGHAGAGGRFVELGPGSEASQGDSAAQVLSCDRAERGGRGASAQRVRPLLGVQGRFLQGGGPWKLFVKDSPYPHSRSYF